MLLELLKKWLFQRFSCEKSIQSQGSCVHYSRSSLYTSNSSHENFQSIYSNIRESGKTKIKSFMLKKWALFLTKIQKTSFSLKKHAVNQNQSRLPTFTHVMALSPPKTRSLDKFQASFLCKPSQNKQNRFFSKKSKIFIFWKTAQKQQFLTCFWSF